MDTVHIETSVVSYLRQRPSSQVVMAAHQLQTYKWWSDERIHNLLNDFRIPIPVICTPEEFLGDDPETED